MRVSNKDYQSVAQPDDTPKTTRASASAANFSIQKFIDDAYKQGEEAMRSLLLAEKKKHSSELAQLRQAQEKAEERHVSDRAQMDKRHAKDIERLHAVIADLTKRLEREPQMEKDEMSDLAQLTIKQMDIDRAQADERIADALQEVAETIVNIQPIRTVSMQHTFKRDEKGRIVSAETMIQQLKA